MKQLFLFFIFQVLISAQSASISKADTLWMHNGSEMKLVANGASRTFQYTKPKESLNVSPGEVLFFGTRNKNNYEGTAYRFNTRCGKIAYAVRGTISDDERTIILYGKAPRRGNQNNCNVTSYFDDTLTFQFLSKDPNTEQTVNTKSPQISSSNRTTYNTTTVSKTDKINNIDVIIGIFCLISLFITPIAYIFISKSKPIWGSIDLIGYDYVSIFFAWIGFIFTATIFLIFIFLENLQLFLPILTYISATTLIGLRVIRNPMMAWYTDQTWFRLGTSAVDILFKSIGSRIGFEYFIMIISGVLSPIGLWVYAIMTARPRHV